MTTAIEISGLTKRYGSLTAVNNLQLEIPAGQIMALLGPNGAGKSTTTEMVLGLVRPDAGLIRVFGKDPIQAVRQGLSGAMLQNGSLLADAPVKSLMKLMHGLHTKPLPLGEVIERAELTPILNTPAGKLSGGQAQRVRFALAIMGDPQLVILDEPTVGMDVDARRRFWATMTDLTDGGRTVVFATHYLDEADEFAQRIVVMAQGGIVADGTGSQIKAVVGGRQIRFAGPTHRWDQLPGVVTAQADGGGWVLTSTDSDTTLRHLLALDGIHNIEITAPRLEDAFLELVS